MNQMDDNMPKIDEKLATLRFICDNNCHITLNQKMCKKCKNKPCVYFCPAQVYVIEDDKDIPNVNYENCLECGTCRISCPLDAVEWKNPKGGCGVRYRFG